LKQRIFYHQLPHIFYSRQPPVPSSLLAINNLNVRHRLFDRYRKIIQRTQSAMMTVYVAAAEAKLREYQHKFGIALERMKQKQGQMLSDERLSDSMINLIDRRSKYTGEYYKHITDVKVHFFRQNPLGDRGDTVGDYNNQKIHCAPSIIVDALHHLSIEQIALLNRGPTYVPPCQLHMSPSLSIDQLLVKQAEPLRRQLTLLFSKSSVNFSQQLTFNRALKKLFEQSFSICVPESIQQRAHYEKELVLSIHRHMKNDNLILRRTADQNNVFYLGHASDFEQKANDHMKNTSSYELIGPIDETMPQQPQLTEMINSIDFILENSHKNKRISKDHLDRMRVKTSNVELPYLYFLPESLPIYASSLQAVH
jgi:hypothetical protein